jgi:hypothetical protein
MKGKGGGGNVLWKAPMISDIINNEFGHPWPRSADHVLTLKLTPVRKPWPRFDASRLTGELLLHMLSQQKDFSTLD